MPNAPPRACAIECSEPQSEMFMTRPPIRLTHAICWRASWSEPSAQTAGSASAAMRMASRPMPLPIGVRAVTAIAAIAWARASTPASRVGVARQAVGEHRVDQRVLAAHVRRRDAGLDVRLLVGDDRAARDLGAGAGRGRDQHQRQLGRRVRCDRRRPTARTGRRGRRRAGPPSPCPSPSRRRWRRCCRRPTRAAGRRTRRPGRRSARRGPCRTGRPT